MTNKNEISVYTAFDGSLWIEDPNGTHGWWSVNPGEGDDDDAFAPWAGRDVAHGTKSGGLTLRYYRRAK